MESPHNLFGYRKYWAKRFGTASILPTSRSEMERLGWDSCDIILITGDAYVDHPSFGMALIGRVLENQGLRVKYEGKGRVVSQSISPGVKATKGNWINLKLG